MLDDVIFVRDTLDLLNFQVCGLEVKFIAEALFVVLVSALATWKAGSLGVRAGWCAGSLGCRAVRWLFREGELPELDREILTALEQRGVWDEEARTLRAGAVLARNACTRPYLEVRADADDITALLGRRTRRKVAALIAAAARAHDELVSDLKRERAVQTARLAAARKGVV